MKSRKLFTIGSGALALALMAGVSASLLGCPPALRALALTFTGIQDLGDDYVYEGWIMVDGTPISTGRFSVDGAGMMTPDSFSVSAANAAAATAFILTIEPAVGDDPAPADTHLIAGDFASGMANLSVAHSAALGTDFANAAGPYILNTPSTAGDDSDYNQGIWWVDPTAGPGPTLVLPTLPAGWTYEGWVAGVGGPVTTGTFLTASGDDSDMGGPTAGPDGTPPFPGQDYINPARVLTSGYAAVISVEPVPDNSPDPFVLKPLLDMTIDDPGIGVLQDMSNNAAATNPTGTAMFTDM